MSVEARASCTTTCASETDDGDYETSSEGAIRETQRNLITDISWRSSDKMGSEHDYQAETPESKGKKSAKESSCIHDTVFASGLLIKSESMPMLKSVTSSEDENEESNVALTSESSLARKKKMKMIVARIGPLLSSTSNLTLSADISRAEIDDGAFEPKKLESKTVLPVLPLLEDTGGSSPSRFKEVTFHEPPRNNELPAESKRSSPSNRLPKTPENPRPPEELDDLIGIAENPHPSIKSFYFPPILERDIPTAIRRQQSRVSKDLDAFLKIDGELGPLQHQLNEIRGKFRALNLTVPSLLSQDHYSSQYTPPSDMSGYWLHRTQTFGRGSKVINSVMSQPRDSRIPDYFENTPFTPVSPDTVPADTLCRKETMNKSIDPGNQKSYSMAYLQKSSSRCVGRNSSNVTGNWPVVEKESYVTVKDSYFQFGGSVDRDLSGSLIPSVSSSCYRCQRRGAFDFQRPHTSSYRGDPEAGRSCSGYVNHKEAVATSNRPVDEERQKKFDKTAPRRDSVEPEAVSLAGKLTETITAPNASPGPKVHMISINTSVKKHYAGSIVSDENPKPEVTEDAGQGSKKNSDSNFRTPGNQSVSASLMVIGSDGSSKTRFVNYTRVDSQTSLIVSKKDQNVMTSNMAYSRKKKSLRDLDIQCSGFNLKYDEKEIVLRKSLDKLVQASMSQETSTLAKNLKTIQVAKTDEKVVIVPILFTDGVPEPPKAPLFNFRRSRHHVHRTNHHILKLEKRSSCITQNSVHSANSTDSTAMASSYMSQKLMNRNSGMSVSCVSRTGSSLRCKNPSRLTGGSKAMPDYRHSRGRHSHSGKAHSEPNKRSTRKVIHGMRSSPEDFLCDT